MADVAMNTLVSTIRAFEAIGNDAIASSASQTDGAQILGHAAAPADPSQARAQEETIRAALDLLGKTEGMGEREVNFALRCFNDLAASGRPITGREAAQALTAAVHGLEMDTGFDPAKTLEEFAAYLSTYTLLQIRETELPADLARLEQPQAQAFVEQNTTVDPAPALAPAPRGTPEMDALLDDLHGLRGSPTLGDSPNFPNGIPSHTRSVRTFFGRSYETMNAYCRQKADDPKALFPGLWRMLAGCFQETSSPPTKYEDRCLLMESMRSLERHLPEIEEAFRRSVAEGEATLTRLTRLTAHANDNGGAEGTIQMLRSGLELLKSEYAAARDEGRLDDFLDRALEGACLPSRIRSLQDYGVDRLAPAELSAAPTSLSGAAVPATPTSLAEAAASLSVVNHFGEIGDVFSPLLEGFDSWAGTRAALLEHLEGREFWPVDLNRGDRDFSVNARVAVSAETLDSMVRPYLEIVLAFKYSD